MLSIKPRQRAREEGVMLAFFKDELEARNSLKAFFLNPNL